MKLLEIDLVFFVCKSNYLISTKIEQSSETVFFTFLLQSSILPGLDPDRERALFSVHYYHLISSQPKPLEKLFFSV